MAESERQYFPFFFEWAEMLDEMPDGKCAQLIRSLSAYARGLALPELDTDVKWAFRLMCGSIDRANEAYNRQCETNKVNGARGGRPKTKNDEFNNNRPVNIKPTGYLETERFFENRNNPIETTIDESNINESNIKRDDDDTKRACEGGADTPVMSSVVVEEELKKLIEGYGERCPSLLPVKGGITKQRITAVNELLSRYTTERVLEAFDLAEQNVFFRGGGDKGWKASFDWLIKPDHLDGIFSGKYDQHTALSGETNGDKILYTDIEW